MIAKLERVHLREVWPHEALDFTCWLEENVDELNEALGLELSIIEREARAGSFNVDLRAEDGDGRAVVIENQLERSDHDHLGKILTYLSAFDARTAIWIVADPRPEHVAAIGWLNESSSADFYMLKIEAVRINGSEPAPLMTLIIGPSDVTRETSSNKRDDSELYALRRRFWTVVSEMANKRTDLHSGARPSTAPYLETPLWPSKLQFTYSTRQSGSRVELYIARGGENGELSHLVFDALEASRPLIEKAFGAPLVWDREAGKTISRISYAIPGGYSDPEDTWPATADRLVDAMMRLEAALRPHIDALAP